MRAKVFEIRGWEIQEPFGEVFERELNDFLRAAKPTGIHSLELAPLVLPPTEGRGFSRGAGVDVVPFATSLYDSTETT